MTPQPPLGPAEGASARQVTAFQGSRRIASGLLADIVPTIVAAQRREPESPLLVFDDATGQLVDLDLRQPAAEPASHAIRQPRRTRAEAPPSAPAPARGVGRPRLGVVAREVTLLPRHWEWLNRQPGGASVTLRKLVDEARRGGAERERVRNAQEATYRFLLAMAGNLPGYEEAMRALFASHRERFEELLAPWPPDIREHALQLAAEAFAGTGDAEIGLPPGHARARGSSARTGARTSSAR